MISCWAIRHKPTGHWMPCRMFRSQQGGWSVWIPGPELEGWGGCSGFDKNPRLFFSRQGAQNALTAWLRGIHRRDHGVSYSLDGPDDWDRMEIEKPPAERRREDMEIVPMTLMEGRDHLG